jgi:hypothetical protein
MGEYLYKTRGSLFTFSMLILEICVCISFFISPILGCVSIFLLAITIINILSLRVYVYKDRVVYKTGIILKTSSKVMPLRKVCVVTYNSSIWGKIFNYGDIIIGTYNDIDSFVMPSIKNAKMFSENINSLL